MGQWYALPRLGSGSSWISSYNNRDQWLQMDLKTEQTVYGVVTQGRGDYRHQYVKGYKVTVSSDGSTWQDVECGRVFDGNQDNTQNKRVQALFENAVKTRYVRIHPQFWNGHISMRAGLVLCETKCKNKHLDYEMQSFMSSSGGPVLNAPWGEGTFAQAIEKDTDHSGNDLGYQHGMAQTCARSR
jgi:hypothetical protein